MIKPLFSQQKLPMLLASMTDPDPAKSICTIRNALYDGADGFLFHMERLNQEFINEDSLRAILDYTCDKPLYTMNYRNNPAKTDDIRIEELLTSIKAGASMIDMMGDMFDPSPMELSFNRDAILRQQQVIEKVHKLGGEVLMSSHTFIYMTTDEVLRHTRELEARGADFIKIAMCVHSEEEALDAMKTTTVVSSELKVPFLHICMGQYGKLHRAIGPLLGSCFALCVQHYTETEHKKKPLLRAERMALDNIDYKPARNIYLGTKTVPNKEV
ncbi:MAG: type I 3-dehydroquinate dehydratase [Chloroflexi bacterium]|nr:type I 3-dehydroquinate dehydratase [Chloroflexota bacterium]